jgi:dynactin complex subunit
MRTPPVKYIGIWNDQTLFEPKPKAAMNPDECYATTQLSKPQMQPFITSEELYAYLADESRDQTSAADLKQIDAVSEHLRTEFARRFLLLHETLPFFQRRHSDIVETLRHEIALNRNRADELIAENAVFRARLNHECEKVEKLTKRVVELQEKRKKGARR